MCGNAESRKPEAFTASVVRAHPSNGFQDPDEAEAETADSGQAAEEGGSERLIGHCPPVGPPAAVPVATVSDEVEKSALHSSASAKPSLQKKPASPCHVRLFHPDRIGGARTPYTCHRPNVFAIAIAIGERNATIYMRHLGGRIRSDEGGGANEMEELGYSRWITRGPWP